MNFPDCYADVRNLGKAVHALKDGLAELRVID